MNQASVLIVDDNPDNLRVLEGILKIGGFKVRPALNGEIALSAVHAALPDLVLLDVRMPGLDGYEVCRRLKRNPETRDIPVIFISALQDMEDKMQAFRAGGVDYIVKPFQDEEVLARVRTHVELSHARKLLAQSNEALERIVDNRTRELKESNFRLEASMRQEKALRRVLALSQSEPDLSSYLEGALRQLTETLGWADSGGKSAIFLKSEHGKGESLDLAASIGWTEGEPAPQSREPADALRFPLLSEGRMLGEMIHLPPRGISPDEENFLRRIADIVALSVARRYADEHVAYLAYFDELTGLPNKASISERLDDELRRADRHLSDFALLFIDLDNFKQINDVLGHVVGDAYLRSVSERLTLSLRTVDLLCRWGSDEFVLLAPELPGGKEHLSAAAQQVAVKIAETLSRPVIVNGQELQLNASIGIALYPEDGTRSEELLSHAELAMSRAKEEGRNQTHFFRPEMQKEAVKRMTMGKELRRGIEAGQFVLHFQPQVDAGGNLAGAESLVRWLHPARGLLLPGEFIPLAEELGLIVPLGEWVLFSGAGWLGKLPAGKLSRLAINVSARQFHEKGFVERCLLAAKTAKISPQRIELEVTESLLLMDTGSTEKKLSALREAGFSFAVDDFGTGYSSLSYLQNLPVQKLKIDRSFVEGVHLDPKKAAIVRTILSLADNLGMSAIAEGVEKAEELDFLKSAGCRLFQGYYFSRPLPPEKFSAQWLR